MKRILFALAVLFALSSSSEAMTLREKVGQLFLIRPDQLDTTSSNSNIHDSKADVKGITVVNSVMLELSLIHI